MDVLCCIKVDYDATESTPILERIFEKYYTRFIMHPLVRPLVLVLFTLWLLSSVFFLPGIDIGFEQDVAMPRDSYLLDFFKVCVNKFPNAVCF